MNEVQASSGAIPPMSCEAIGRVAAFEAEVAKLPQIEIATSHILHGGVYSRTILIPAGVVLTGALIKISTTLTICGDTTVFLGQESGRFVGYNIFPASAGRKQAFIAHADTYVTMSFSTKAKTIEEAEEEFTDEFENLISRKDSKNNYIVITGE